MADQLFLHEVVDIVGRGGQAHMGHVVGFDAGAAADRGLELLGTPGSPLAPTKELA